MAEKHKSKYKKPENKKPTYRKDIKDYTLDDKEGGLNPKTTGDAHLTTFRKTDKEMQDDGKMYPTYKDDDRLYKDLEDGEYDPKTAAKRLQKRQDVEEKNLKDLVVKEKVEKLTREQKEELIREYIRRKITKVLMEQTAAPAPEEEAPAADTPAEELPVEEPAPAAEPAPTDMSAPAAPAPTDPAAAPAPTDPATAETPAETPTEEPAAEPEQELDPAAQEALAVQRFVDHLKTETGNIARIKSISKVINSVLNDSEPEDYKNFFEMLRSLAINKLQRGQSKKSNTNKQ
jgi:hypothetical protein